MILESKLDKLFEDCTIRSLIWIKCDYCNTEIQRVKKSVIKLRKNLAKDTCGNPACSQKKREEVLLLKYGVSNPNTPEAIAKQKLNNIEKYGCDSYLKTDEFKEKRKKKLLENYGVDTPLAHPVLLNKHRQTCLERYNVDNISKTPDFDKKRKQNSVQKYGVDSPSKLEEVKLKKKATSLEKYGVENYSQTSEFKEKYQKTSVERFGVSHPSKNKQNREKAKKTNQKLYGQTNYAKTDEFKERYIKTCLEKYGVPNPLMLNQTYGKAQGEIKDWLNSLGFNFTADYKIMPPKEIDLYDPNVNLAIEYCGLFWHNEMSLEPRNQYYHYDKYLACSSKNIRLFTIFEDEWKEKQEICKSRILSALNLSPRIYARKCKVVELSKKDFSIFCEENHLQGSNQLGFVFYGLQYENDLIAAISLGRHHRGRNQIVLDRLCFKKNYAVVGGSSKLFKSCIIYATKNDYKEIISWSDNRWSEGNVYSSLGFQLDEELKPDYCYVNFNAPVERISKQSQKKSNTGCPKDMTEKEFALQNGLARLWDCGKKRWSYKIA
jgi:hypothetical protein